MDTLQTKRKSLNQKQTELRRAITSTPAFENVLQQFLDHHAMLHTKDFHPEGKSGSDLWSYEDAILNDLSEELFRRIPINCDHSIAWCIWHIARIEDVAMNILVAGQPQMLFQGNWFELLGINYQHTGNGMAPGDIASLSISIDLQALRSYRKAVGRNTQQIVTNLQSGRITEKVDPGRIRQIKESGILLEAAYGIADYWRNLNIAGLLLMPATRHNLVHLNEALRLKKQRR